MPLIHYKAYKGNGVTKVGEIEAADVQAAVKILNNKGLYPYEARAISEPRQTPWWNRELWENKSISQRDLVDFSKDMATLLGAKIPLDEALQIVKSNAYSRRLKQNIEVILARILEGALLSTALEEQENAFPEYYISLVKAGEASGSLEHVFKDLSSFLEHSLKIRSQLQSTLIYPMTLLVVAIVAMIVLITTLIPTIAPLFEGREQETPLFIVAALYIQAIFSKYWLIITLSTLTAMMFVYVFMKTGTARQKIDKTTLFLPLFGSLIRESETAKVTRTIATLISSGVPLVNALQIVQPIPRNNIFKSSLLKSQKLLKEGANLHDAFKSVKVFPDPTLRLVLLGEKTGNLEEMLFHIAKIFEIRVQTRINVIMTALTPLITIIIGLGVGALILSVMNAILSVNDLAFK